MGGNVYIIKGNDIYCPESREYVFVYNDANALCCCYLKEGEAAELSKKSHKYNGEYWSAFLSGSGDILDDSRYCRYEYSDVAVLRGRYLKPSFDFCRNAYMYEWIDTKNYAKD